MLAFFPDDDLDLVDWLISRIAQDDVRVSIHNVERNMSFGALEHALLSGQRPPDYALPYVVIASDDVTQTILEKVFLLVHIAHTRIQVTQILTLLAFTSTTGKYQHYILII